MSTNVRITEAQARTAKLLQYIINEAVTMANGFKEYDGNPFKVKLKAKSIIEGFTSVNFTTTMTTKRYFDNLAKNPQEPFRINPIKDELTLNPEKANLYISIGENHIRFPANPEEPVATKSGKH